MVSHLPHQLYGMVQVNILIVLTPSEDSTAIQLPSAGISCHCQRSNVCQVVHGSGQVIGCQCVIACDAHYWGPSLHIILASSSQTSYTYATKVQLFFGKTLNNHVHFMKTI